MRNARFGWAFVGGIAAALAVLAAPAMVQAQNAGNYPEKPVRIIVPFAPAGPTDVVARLIAQKLSERLGKQFYIDNIVGAGGNNGMGQAARAPADGYTILFVSSSYVVNPSLYPKIPYDPFKDFQPITVAGDAPNALAGQSDGAGEDRRGADRLHQEEPRQGLLRLRRHRHHAASFRRIVPAHAQARHRPCAVQRRRPGDPGARRRSHADGVHVAAAGDPADQRGQDPRARGRRGKACGGASQRADARPRPGCPTRRPTPCRRCWCRRERRGRSSTCSTARSRRSSRCPTSRSASRRSASSHRQHAGGAFRADQGRDREVGQGHPRRQHQDGVARGGGSRVIMRGASA